MAEPAAFYLAKGLASSTKKSYESSQRRYLHFCKSHQVNPLPLSEHILCHFAANLAQEGLKHQSIKAYLAGIRNLQITQGLPDPNSVLMPRLHLVLKGIKRHQAESTNNCKRTRLPITLLILKQLQDYWSANVSFSEAVLLWAASCICFFGFFRSGEICIPSRASFNSNIHLTPSDIAVDNKSRPTMVQIHLKQSKTDQFHEGADIVIGATGQSVCPVAALLQYLTIRGSDPGPLFCSPGGQPLIRSSFVGSVQSALVKLGYDPTLYAGHSFRIGAATTAASVGVSDAIIMSMGRWNSMAYAVYVHTPREVLAAIPQQLLQHSSPESLSS